MKRKRIQRQGGLLALLEPERVLTPATRQTVISMIAALLLEVATAEAKTMPETMAEKDDEQDRP